MTSYIRRIVWVVLITACLCGRLAAQSSYVPDKVGKWKYNSQPTLERMAGLSAAEKTKIQNKFAALLSLIQNTKTFNPPMGFDAEVFANYLPENECWSWENKSCPAHPAVIRLEAFVYSWFLGSDGYVYRAHEAETEAMISVNDLTRALGAYPFGSNVHRVLPDGRQILYMPREIPLRVSGFQVYEKPLGRGKHFFLTKRDRLPWVPVTREQFLLSLIRDREEYYRKRAEQERTAPRISCGDAYKKWMSERERRRQENEKTYQELKKIVPAQAEQLRATLEKVEAERPAQLLKEQAECEAREKRAPPPVDVQATYIEPLRAELARLTPAERASQAWYVPGKESYNASGLVAPTAPEAGGLVAVNPDFFDRSRPRTDFQIICVEVTSKPDFELREDDVPFWRLHQFITTMDWQRVAALLD